MHPGALALVPLLLIAPGAGTADPATGIDVAPSAPRPAPISASRPSPAVDRPDPPRMRLPLAGPARVVNPFDAPDSRYGPGHRGVDLAADAGATVLAAAGGTVAFAGPVAGKGVVSIQHPGGLRTTYEPVRALVQAGDNVAAGDPIARVRPGHPRCGTTTCLHWGVRTAQGGYLDPMLLTRPWRVVLKPWGDGDR